MLAKPLYSEQPDKGFYMYKEMQTEVADSVPGYIKNLNDSLVADSSKYLSVTISEDLTWRKHIEAQSTRPTEHLVLSAVVLVTVQIQ